MLEKAVQAPTKSTVLDYPTSGRRALGIRSISTYSKTSLYQLVTGRQVIENDIGKVVQGRAIVQPRSRISIEEAELPTKELYNEPYEDLKNNSSGDSQIFPFF